MSACPLPACAGPRRERERDDPAELVILAPNDGQTRAPLRARSVALTS